MPINFISTITEFVKPSNLFKKTTDCGLIKKIAASAVVAAGTLAMATTTVALDMTFTGASNNNWLDAANWSGGTGPAPTATDNVTIPNLKKAEIYASGSVVQGYAALVNVQSGGTIAIKGGPNPGDAALLHSNQDITNSGDIIIQGGAGNSNAFGVLYAFFNNLTNNNGATIQITAGSAPNAKASLNMYAGTLTNGGTINVSGGTGTSATAKLFSGPVTNNGTIHFKATGSDVMGGVRTFDNYGDLIVEGGTVAGVTAGVSVTGDLTNYNGGAITLTGGSANGASSCLTVKGNLTNKDGGDITVTAGSASNANVSLHVTGNLANETGGIVNLSGGHIMNVSASIQVDDDLENDGTINVTGGDNYNASATLNVGGDLTNNNGGIINLTSVSSSAHTKVNVTGAATNNGTINVYGQSHYSRVNLKAASVSNNGTINFKGGTGSNAAKLSITGNLTNETNGTITIEGGSGSIAYAALYADGELTNNGSILLEDGAGYAAFAGVAAQTITNNGTIAGPGLLIADTAFTCENGSWLKPGGYGANKFARLSMAGNFSFMAGSNIEILLGTAMNQSGSLGSHPLFGGLLPPPVVTFNGTTTIHVAKAVANSTTSGQNQTYEIIEANTIDTNGAATGDGARSATAGADGTIVLDNVTVEATPGIDLVSLDIANDGTYDTMTLTALLKIVSSGGSNQGKLEGLGFTGEQTGQILGGVSCQTGGATAGYNTAQMLGSNVQGQILGAAGAMGWGGNNNTDDVFRGQCYRSGKRALWAKMLGAWENQDAVAGQTEAFNTNLFGIQFGADRAFGRSLVGGIAASGAWARTNSNSAHNNTDLFDVQLYGAANLRRGWMLSSSLGYQYMNFNGTRTVSSDIYNSTHAGNMLKGGFQLEKEFNCCGIDVSPIYGWEYYGLWQDAYSETSPTGNISGAGMTLEADSSYALYQRLGGRLALLRKRRLSVDVTTSWLHNFGDANITMIGTIAAGNAISLVGAPMHRNLAELEFDATYELTRRLGLTVGYTGRFANGYDLHTVDGMLRWDF